jgi:O-acetylhomoserine/O-acetylserine sulfhydrylase-like pyridoxal-dependent enzyme
MSPEMVVIHSGYEIEPATSLLGVPIYQTRACRFKGADQAAARVNLRLQGHRYNHIDNRAKAVPGHRGRRAETCLCCRVTGSDEPGTWAQGTALERR